jgi:hypothetical protein
MITGIDRLEQVLVLGAGASRTDKSPMQSELFRTFWEQRDSLRKEAADQADVMERHVLEPLRYYFKRFFGIDVEAASTRQIAFPTFEEALGVLDLAVLNDEEFWDFGYEAQELKIHDVRTALLWMIAIALTRGGLQPETHLRLVKRLLTTGELHKTAFITLNYDTFIDTALRGSPPVSDIDYGFEFRFDDYAAGGRGTRPAANAVPLLKLHGSLDWLYCRACHALDRGGRPDEVKRVIPGLSFGTPFCVCGNVKQPVIVPPTFFKSLSHVHTRQIWHAAEEVLSGQRLRRIVFCGYSFPDADLHVKYLMKRAQIRRPGVEVIVLNHFIGKDPALLEQEAVRYRRFFGATASVQVPRLGFEEFATDAAIGRPER